MVRAGPADLGAGPMEAWVAGDSVRTDPAANFVEGRAKKNGSLFGS
jgi:hypothetical protein